MFQRSTTPYNYSSSFWSSDVTEKSFQCLRAWLWLNLFQGNQEWIHSAEHLCHKKDQKIKTSRYDSALWIYTDFITPHLKLSVFVFWYIQLAFSMIAICWIFASQVKIRNFISVKPSYSCFFISSLKLWPNSQDSKTIPLWLNLS